jgi:DMSO/TMAO reductase YedYZ molybdopterin-dependent catalytic subunit
MAPQIGSRTRSAFAAGVVAMTVAVLLALAWRLASGILTLPEIIGDHLVRLIPGELFEIGIQSLGPLAKKGFVVGLMLGQVVVGGGLAIVLARFSPGAPNARGRTERFFGRAFVGALLAEGALTLVLGGAEALNAGIVMLALVSVLYSAVLTGIERQTAGPVVKQGGTAAKSVWFVTAPSFSRRGVLVLAIGAATAATATALVRGGIGQGPAAESPTPRTNVPPSTTTPDQIVADQPTAVATTAPTNAIAGGNTAPTSAVATSTAAPASATASGAPTTVAIGQTTDVALAMPDGAVPRITSLADFYKVSKNFLSDPRLDAKQWHLSVEGLVNKPTVFSLNDIRALPSVEKQHTLTCISNDVGGDLIGNATWKGVRLADILQLVGVKEGVRKVALAGADGYEDSILLERAMNPGAVLVYEMDGAPLLPEHGFPLRLLVPNIYGMKNLKWITKIELLSSEFQGYWQRSGWSDPALIKTMSRIDVAKGGAAGQPISIAGIAFAGERGISTVQISDDGGKTWQAAQVESPDIPNVWSRWVARWIPKVNGSTRLLVRAVDGKGEIQTSKSAAPFPDGASGWHSVDVRVS